MPDLTNSVGEGGTNADHDVALVQAMLRVVKDAKGAPYLASAYTGTYDAATKGAITAFQTDQKLAEMPAAKADASKAAMAGVGDAKAAAAANVNKGGFMDKAGVSKAALAGVGDVKAAAAQKLDKSAFIDKDSATFKALTKALPADYQDIRIIEGTKTVYLPMSETSAKASAKAIEAKADLDPAFRGTVAKLVTEMYAQHKIALSIPGDGWNRDFAAQAVPAAAGTGANPGESNHQYGKAVDIGFQGLRWVAGDGQIKTDNFWLAAAKMPPDKQQAFWEVRNKIAFTALGLFKTNKKGDLIHVQAYSDGFVSYGRSLAALLQAVSPKGMKWGVDLSTLGNQYRTDFGLGGATYAVGNALKIWGGQATVAKADLAKALNAKLASDNAFSVEKFFGLPQSPAIPAKPGAKPPPPLVLKDADIKDAYLATMKTTLKGEFEAANNNRGQWKPVQ
jgi:hypothetical protein